MPEFDLQVPLTKVWGLVNWPPPARSSPLEPLVEQEVSGLPEEQLEFT